jgi:phage N-6-adenine-methyltransferase
MGSSERMDWPTPRATFAQLHAEFAFTVDACASPGNACLPRYWTETDEGLMQPWEGERVWMNPPYGRQLPRWMEKAWNESRVADLIVALVPSRTDTRWWHEYAMDAEEIRFVRGRLRFHGAVNAAPFPVSLVIWRGSPSPSRLSSSDLTCTP